MQPQNEGNPPRFSSWLEQMSQALGYNSLSAVAEQLGVNSSTISRWRSGTMKPGLEQLIKLSNLFGVDLKVLLVLTGHITPEAADIGPADYYRSSKVGDRIEAVADEGTEMIMYAGLDPEQTDDLNKFWRRRTQEELARLEDAVRLAQGVLQYGPDPALMQEQWPRLLATDLSRHVGDVVFGILASSPPRVRVPHSAGVMDADIDLLRSRWEIERNHPLGLIQSIRVIQDREGKWRFELVDGRGDAAAWSPPYGSADAALEAARTWHLRHPDLPAKRGHQPSLW